jgi:membrane protein YdbS with pleckstrin-like domain
MMLSRKEQDFIAYWEANRTKQKKLFRQWLIGLPVGLLFAVPVLINYITGWHKRAVMVAGASFNPLILLIAVMAIITFSAIFYKQHQWDQLEQRYHELKAREEE